MQELHRISQPEIRDEYGADHVEDLDFDMLRHNLECKLNVLENPKKFPRADVEALEAQVFAHQSILAEWPGRRGSGRF